MVMGVVAALALPACSKAPKQVGIMNVPVMPGSKLVGHEVSHSRQGDSMSDLSDYTLNSWKFETKASADDILAFYADKAPEAKREDDDDPERGIGLRWDVAGPKVKEIDFRIKGSTYSIAESTKD